MFIAFFSLLLFLFLFVHNDPMSLTLKAQPTSSSYMSINYGSSNLRRITNYQSASYPCAQNVLSLCFPFIRDVQKPASINAIMMESHKNVYVLVSVNCEALSKTTKNEKLKIELNNSRNSHCVSMADRNVK